MKILIIGGTYFFGRAFTELLVKEKAKRTKKDEQIEIYLLNRGNVEAPYGINGSCACDRHDTDALKDSGLFMEHFDVIADFCAYKEGDISSFLDALKPEFEQYIFISTCDVYRRFEGKAQDEEAPFEDRDYPGQEGEYIKGKIRLENELREACGARNAAFTSIRPAIIYGPGNYAPREGIYFNWIEKAGQILQPYDATGSFQLVYVEDAARAVFQVCMNEQAYNEAFNVCGPKLYTYNDFLKALKKAVTRKFECVYMTVGEINKKQIALPFPLTELESEEYTGEKIKKLGISYRALEEGLAQSWLSHAY
ncbi:MAG: NAD-dependent epimerase/dehydratase family protein [Lachnospiraceae bacterium]|nr:NAD-dependent epimerase/dehydratase family protein [Lachnospiraceae bacterium]